jgi:hypothetical protein
MFARLIQADGKWLVGRPRFLWNFLAVKGGIQNVDSADIFCLSREAALEATSPKSLSECELCSRPSEHSTTVKIWSFHNVYSE